jgi:hypothetical protein
MTIERASLRIALLAVVLFTILGCVLVTVIYPAIRGPNTAWVFWIILIGAWLVLGGGAGLLWAYNRSRAVGLLVAFVVIPFLMGAYWWGLQFLNSIH